MFTKHGYLTNILSSLRLIAPTTGYVHQGNDMGDEWNHSDDELAFFTYWPLVRFAFTGELRAKYLTVVREHLEIERPERYPDLELHCRRLRGERVRCRRFRLDLARHAPRHHCVACHQLASPGYHEAAAEFPWDRQLRELLPPGERLIARINTQPFILDQGDDATDFPGDEFLLGYWLGRHVGAISPP